MTYFPLATVTPTVSTSKTTATGYQPNTARATLVVVLGDIALTSAQTAVVQFCIDSNSTPTTVVGSATCNDAPAAGTVNHPFTFVGVVPAGQYYLVKRSSGSGTVTVPYVIEVAL